MKQPTAGNTGINVRNHHHPDEESSDVYLRVTHQAHRKGYETMHHNPDRLDAVAGEIEKLGCKVISQYALLGEWDVLSIIDAPDTGTAVHMNIDLSARGTSTRMVMAALTSDEFKESLKGDVHLA